jgi:hypothetical protein
MQQSVADRRFYQAAVSNPQIYGATAPIDRHNPDRLSKSPVTDAAHADRPLREFNQASPWIILGLSEYNLGRLKA